MATVLVVEDEWEIAEAVVDALADAGHEAIVATNGREAMDALATMPRPCLILLDLMMPVMSGWDVLEALQANVHLAPIPVVVTSAAPDARAKDKAKAVMKKPYDLDHLLGLVEQYCSHAGDQNEPRSMVHPQEHDG